MKFLKHIYTLLIAIAAMSCDDQIYPELNDAPEVLVIDAWINDKPEDQVVKISKTQSYFDNSKSGGVTGAEVYLTDNEGTRFDFADRDNGTYVWPYSTSSFGKIGNSYTMTVKVNGQTYTASSQQNRVPLVDSVTFKYEEKDNFIQEDYYLAEFWSRDIEGEGDTYWIKSYKNGQFLNKPSEINIAWDAGFSSGGSFDSTFIPPIREAINPIDIKEDENQGRKPPFADGDSIYVEIHSITHAAHNFLTELRTQTDRPGGFAALFDTPLNNIRTNIKNTTSDDPVVGFFCVSAVQGNGKKLDITQVPKNP